LPIWIAVTSKNEMAQQMYLKIPSVKTYCTAKTFRGQNYLKAIEDYF
jgi:type VI protein secretion system component Hcp